MANTVMFCSFLCRENGGPYFLYIVISVKRTVVHNVVFISISGVGMVISSVQYISLSWGRWSMLTCI